MNTTVTAAYFDSTPRTPRLTLALPSGSRKVVQAVSVFAMALGVGAASCLCLAAVHAVTVLF